MTGWDHTLFLIMNAPSGTPAWLIQTAILLANSPIIVGPAILIGLWIWGPSSHRARLLAVAGAMLMGQGVNQIIGLFVFEPRPFMVPIGYTWLMHLPDNGFPSDHATFVWTLAAGLILTGAARSIGTLVFVYGTMVAWARVYLGVHFPDDMLASAVVALVSGSFARVARPAVAAWLLPFANRAYETLLVTFHLPPALFPREPR